VFYAQTFAMNDPETESVDSTARIPFKDDYQLKSQLKSRRRLRFPRYKGKSSRKSGLNPIWGNKLRHDSEAPCCEAPSKRAFKGEGLTRLDTEDDSHFFEGFPLHEEMQLFAYDQEMKAIPGEPFADIDCEDMSVISIITTSPAAGDSFDCHMDPCIYDDSYNHGENYDIKKSNAITDNLSCAGMSLEAATGGLFTNFLDAVDGGMQSVVQRLDLTSKSKSATGSCASILDSSSDCAEDEGFTSIQEPSLKRRVNEPLQPPLPAEEGVEVHLSQPEPSPMKLPINETALQQNERKAWEKPVMKTSRSYPYYTQDIQNRPWAKASNEDNGRISLFGPLRSISKFLSRRKLEEKIEMEHQVQKRHRIAESQDRSLLTVATDLSTTYTISSRSQSESEHPLKVELGAYDDGADASAPNYPAWAFSELEVSSYVHLK
jgi:hypothetical protein